MKEFLEDYDDERDDPKYYKFVSDLTNYGIISDVLFFIFQRQSI